MIIGRSLTPLNSSRTLRAVRRRETVRRSDDNSRRKVQNVRGDSSGLDTPRAGQRREGTGSNGALEIADLKDFTWHDLRHTFASWFIMKGASLDQLPSSLAIAACVWSCGMPICRPRTYQRKWACWTPQLQHRRPRRKEGAKRKGKKRAT